MLLVSLAYSKFLSLRSSAGLSLIPEYLGFGFLVLPFRLWLVSQSPLNFCEQRIVFVGNQMRCLVYSLPRARTALCLELGLAPLYDPDNVVRVHEN